MIYGNRAVIVSHRPIARLAGANWPANGEAIAHAATGYPLALAVVEAAQDISGMLADHQPEPGDDDNGNTGGEFCFECETEWPCVYGRIAGALDAWEAAQCPG